MTILTKPIPITDLQTLAKKRFGNLVKAVVDVNREIVAIDADLHADEEAALLAQGSSQSDLWGINLYPDLPADQMIEFDSMINLRPSAGNMSRGIDYTSLQHKIRVIINKLIVQ